MSECSSFTDLPIALFRAHTLPHLSLKDLVVLKAVHKWPAKWASTIDQAVQSKLSTIMSDTLDHMTLAVVEALTEHVHLAFDHMTLDTWRGRRYQLEMSVGHHKICLSLTSHDFKNPVLRFEIFKVDEVILTRKHLYEVSFVMPLAKWKAEVSRCIKSSLHEVFNCTNSTNSTNTANYNYNFDSINNAFQNKYTLFTMVINHHLSLINDLKDTIVFTADQTFVGAHSANRIPFEDYLSYMRNSEHEAWVQGTLMPVVQMAQRTMEAIGSVLMYPRLRV